MGVILAGTEDVEIKAGKREGARPPPDGRLMEEMRLAVAEETLPRGGKGRILRDPVGGRDRGEPEEAVVVFVRPLVGLALSPLGSAVEELVSSPGLLAEGVLQEKPDVPHDGLRHVRP